MFQPDADWGGRTGAVGFRRIAGAWDVSLIRLVRGLFAHPGGLTPPHFVALAPGGAVRLFSFRAGGFIAPRDSGVILADPLRLARLP